jgi:2,6-dihydroxypseudooxynicotine hydrolase
VSAQQTRESIGAILNPGRMLADGIPYPDFKQAVEEIAGLEEWYDFWVAKGEQYESLGDAALASGNPVSGGEWLWHGALSFHYAQFMWFHEPARREHGQRRKVELYNRAAGHLLPPAERIEIPFEGVTIPGFLRLPLGSRPSGGWPCALLIGGLESTKEESLLFEHMCLRRGLATFSFDGPGQGELFFQAPLQPRFERYSSAVVDYLESRPELDRERLGVLGRSLGGHYAIRSSAQDPRLRACVAWGFFYDMSDFDTMPPGTQRGFAYVTDRADPDEAKAYLQEALTLEDVAGNLRAPTLLLNGRHDPIFPPRQMELVIDALAAAPIEVVIEEAGDHCCHNMAHLVRPRMADWLVASLRGA